MAENPDPEKLGYIAAGVFAILAGIGTWWGRISNRSAPCDAKNEAFHKKMQEDMARFEATLKEAVSHAQEAHREIYDRMRAVETASAVLDTRLTSCQRGLETIKRNGHK